MISYKPHYENTPFEIPQSWEWVMINDIAFVTKLAGFEYTKYIADSINKTTEVPLFKGKNITDGEVVYEFESFIPREVSDELFRSQVSKKCLLTPYVGTIGNIGIHNKEGVYHLGSNVGKIELFNNLAYNLYEEYVKFYLMSSFGYKELTKHKKATAQESISIDAIRNVLIPIPPLREQNSIIQAIEKWFSFIDILEQDASNLKATIQQTKSKILDLAIHGKLVPQDPADEPAIELLKRINPDFVPADTSHYGQLPNGWTITTMENICSLGDGKKICNKELPYLDMKYFRGKDIEYKDNGKLIPANTTLILVDGENSGETFITKEEGYQGSTLKILSFERCINQEYVLLFIKVHQKMLKENKVGSAIPHLNKKIFKQLLIPIPPIKEQLRIVTTISTLCNYFDSITADL